jgi:hypothetical protein
MFPAEVPVPDEVIEYVGCCGVRLQHGARVALEADINLPTGFAASVENDPGCVKTTSQIGIVSGFPETIDAKVH